jgi:hypothetical protein
MLPISSAAPIPSARAEHHAPLAPLRRSRPLRRLALACVLAIMACEPNVPRSTPDQADTRAPVQFLAVPPVQPGQPRTLLQEMADRPDASPEEWDAEARDWVLPYKTKRIDVVLLIGVAKGDEALIRRVLAPHAHWGLPDRRMLGAEPIFGPDGGERFFAALHRAAMRFPENATWESQATLEGVTQMYATGAEPMWSYYKREGASDWIVMRKAIFKGRPMIDYVGVWEGDPPTELTEISADIGPPPPLAPPIDRSLLPPMPMPE